MSKNRTAIVLQAIAVFYDIGKLRSHQAPVLRTPAGRRSVRGMVRDTSCRAWLLAAICMGHVARVETGWWCPSGHRFTRSPWHRSAKREGVTGLRSSRHVVSGRTPVYRSGWGVYALW